MKNNLLAGALVALGLCLGGVFIYCGISKYADKEIIAFHIYGVIRKRPEIKFIYRIACV